MNENDQDIEIEAGIPDLTERLENMERDNRRWRWGALILTAGFFGSIGFTLYSRNCCRSLDVQQLVLRDSQGIKRGELGVDRFGVPRLTLMDDKGRETARLEGTLDHSSQLLMYDRGRLRVDLAATPKGALMHMMDDRMVPASTIYLNDEGPGLHLRTRDGETHVRSSVPADPSSRSRDLASAEAEGPDQAQSGTKAVAVPASTSAPAPISSLTESSNSAVEAVAD